MRSRLCKPLAEPRPPGNIPFKPELENWGEEYNRDEIEAKIARGFAELERGEGMDGDEFFEQLRLRV